jgi:hypothetical protein
MGADYIKKSVKGAKTVYRDKNVVGVIDHFL